MNAKDQTRLELINAQNLLMRRRNATSDAAEKEQLNDSIEIINEQLQELGQASLLEAASIAAAAGAELEKVVATARTGAFDAFISQAEKQIDRLKKIPGAVAGRVGASARPATAPRRPPAKVKKSAKKKVAKKSAKKPAAKKAKKKSAKRIRR